MSGIGNTGGARPFDLAAIQATIDEATRARRELAEYLAKAHPEIPISFSTEPIVIADVFEGASGPTPFGPRPFGAAKQGANAGWLGPFSPSGGAVGASITGAGVAGSGSGSSLLGSIVSGVVERGIAGRRLAEKADKAQTDRMDFVRAQRLYREGVERSEQLADGVGDSIEREARRQELQAGELEQLRRFDENVTADRVRQDQLSADIAASARISARILEDARQDTRFQETLRLERERERNDPSRR